MENYKKNKDWE